MLFVCCFFFLFLIVVNSPQAFVCDGALTRLYGDVGRQIAPHLLHKRKRIRLFYLNASDVESSRRFLAEIQVIVRQPINHAAITIAIVNYFSV